MSDEQNPTTPNRSRLLRDLFACVCLATQGLLIVLGFHCEAVAFGFGWAPTLITMNALEANHG